MYIPTFALERAQEVLYALERLHEKNQVPEVPVFIDSPLAIAVTEIYKLHPESLAEDVRARILSRNDPFSPPGATICFGCEVLPGSSESGQPCIVIAGSGMCEGGRILYHFTKALEDRKNSVVIVGFMAEHTLGRRLVEGRKSVKVLGVERDVIAEIHTVNGLSAHAGRDDLIAFAQRTGKVGRVARVALVHGEEQARQSLAEGLKEAGVPKVIQSKKGERVEL